MNALNNNYHTINMKNFLLLSIFCVQYIIVTAQDLPADQILTFEQLEDATKRPKGSFERYISKDGAVYNVGDVIKTGFPSSPQGYFVEMYAIDIAGNITYPGREASNIDVRIKKIRAEGSKKTGFKATFRTTGNHGLSNYFLTIDDAVLLGEMQTDGYTNDQALEKLKQEKDKLELDLITKEEYEARKKELIKFID